MDKRLTEQILNMEICEPVRNDCIKWLEFMDNEVVFNFADSKIHTTEHCGRVLLFSLLIADALGMSAEDKEILALASCFHDSRREDDMLDVGHGERAAEYYKSYCEEHGMHFYETCYNVMKYHDLGDYHGYAALTGDDRAVMLYKIFKDADALDRYRFGVRGLNKGFLRTREAHGLSEFAWEIHRDIYKSKPFKGDKA